MEDFLALLERVEYEKTVSAQEKRMALEFNPDSVIDDRTSKSQPTKKKKPAIKKKGKGHVLDWSLINAKSQNNGTIYIPPPEPKDSESLKGIQDSLGILDEVDYFKWINKPTTVESYADLDLQVTKKLYEKYAVPKVADPWVSNHGSGPAADLYGIPEPWKEEHPVEPSWSNPNANAQQVLSDIKKWKDMYGHSHPAQSVPVPFEKLTWYPINVKLDTVAVYLAGGPADGKTLVFEPHNLNSQFEVPVLGTAFATIKEHDETVIEHQKASYTLKTIQQNLSDPSEHQKAYVYVFDHVD